MRAAPTVIQPATFPAKTSRGPIRRSLFGPRHRSRMTMPRRSDLLTHWSRCCSRVNRTRSGAVGTMSPTKTLHRRRSSPYGRTPLRRELADRGVRVDKAAFGTRSATGRCIRCRRIPATSSSGDRPRSAAPHMRAAHVTSLTCRLKGPAVQPDRHRLLLVASVGASEGGCAGMDAVPQLPGESEAPLPGKRKSSLHSFRRLNGPPKWRGSQSEPHSFLGRSENASTAA